MKILVIASFPDSILQFRGNLLKEMKASGASVKVIAPNLMDNHKVVSELNLMGVEVGEYFSSRTGTNPIKDIFTFSVLLKTIKEYSPDVVLAYTVKPIVYGMLASWIARVNLKYALVTGLGFAFSNELKGYRLLVARIAREMYRLAFFCSTKVIFQNPDDEQSTRRLGILPKNIPSVVVNGSGIDVDVYTQVPFIESKVSFLLIARLIREKGVVEFANAARVLRKKYPEINFHLVGWIDSNPTAIKPSELDCWMRDEVLVYHGKLQDVKPIIAKTSIYVLPSYREGTPRTVLEAMAMGRPIITTDAPGCRETVMNGKNGFLVPVKSVDALVSAMEKFILDPELVLIMGKESRRIAEEKYDVRKVNAVMLREMSVK